MSHSLLKLELSKNSEIEFFPGHLVHNGEKVLYSDVDGVAYQYTTTQHRVNFVPVGKSHKFYVSIKALGKKHTITFSGSHNTEVYGKLANAVDVLIKPFVSVTLLLEFAKENKLEIAELTITPAGIYKKRTWRGPELLPWNQYYNSLIHKGHVQILKADEKKKYILFASPFMASTNAVVLPDVLNFLFSKQCILDEATRNQIIAKKMELVAISAHDVAQVSKALDACPMCGEKPEEGGQKFCGKCGSPLLATV